jgi:glycosyltransferase involved in cell wall biosynthesis
MCTYNGEAWVGEAIQSILDQSFSDWHLYITDDGSSDSTAQILAQFKEKSPEKITLNLLEQNCSPKTPTNFSIQFFLQNEQFSAFTILDQDDVAEPNWLLNCSKLLKGKIKVLRCKNARFDESLTEMKYVYPAASQIVALREVIERVGERVDRNHPTVSDTEYLKRVERDAIANKHAVVLTPFLCQKMRIHGANQTILGTTKPK